MGLIDNLQSELELSPNRCQAPSLTALMAISTIGVVRVLDPCFCGDWVYGMSPLLKAVRS